MAEGISFIYLNDFQAPALDIFARLNENQLRHYYEPYGGLFVAESPLVVGRALDAGCEPVAVLVDRREVDGREANRSGILPFPVDEMVSEVPADHRDEDGRDAYRSETAPLPIDKGMSELSAGEGRDAAATAGASFSSSEGKRRGSLRDTADILNRCSGIPIYTAPAEVLFKMTGFKLTRGLLCAMRRPPLPPVREILQDASRVAVIENVMNPTNVGAIFRSAAALGMDAVLLTAGCSDPLYRRAARVSMGTVFQISWTVLPQDTWRETLHKAGFFLAAMALTDDALAIDDPRLAAKDRLAVVLGTEGEGLTPETIAGCDFVVKIPMAHGVDSLNVAAASAVAFWTLGRRSQREAAGGFQRPGKLETNDIAL